MINNLCTCGEPADGLDDIHCQLCWERLCSDLWWQVVGGLQEVMEEGMQ